MSTKLAGVTLLAMTALGAPPRVATFRADATPPPGEPLIWVMPVSKVADPLWAKGVVIESGRDRYVLCALDWCGVGGATERLLRERLAEAAGTNPARVAVHSVHQHAAPYIDGDGYRVLDGLLKPPLRMSQAYLERLAGNIAAAIRTSLRDLRAFDRIGLGEAEVDKVASARRLFDENGKALTRYSGSAKDPRMAAMPEGDIDRKLRTITLASGEKPLTRLHYYATHPQTFCCDGVVSADFVGQAREAMEVEEKIPQIYFTGCSGDVTVGKYNDTSVKARQDLGVRLLAGLRAAVAATRYEPVGTVAWRSVPLPLPKRSQGAWETAKLKAVAESAEADGTQRYKAAIALAYAQRKTPFVANLLKLGKARILMLPGEPMLEFQKFALKQAPGAFVAVAGYGDISPGYLCTDKAFEEGGYEPSASNSGPGTEAVLKKAIRQLMSEMP